MTNKIKSLRLKGILIYVGAIFLFQEMVFRFCFPLPELSNFNRITYQILGNNANSQAYLRNGIRTWQSSLDTNAVFDHKLNKYGYRDDEWKVKKPSGKKRIFFIGDSFVEGMMANQNQTIKQGYINAAEKEADNLQIFNCGMMGIGMNEYVKFIGDAVPVFKPDEVYLIMYANDLAFKDQYHPTKILEPTYHSFITPRLFTIASQIGKNNQIPFKFNPPVIPYFKAVPDSSNQWTFHENTLKAHVTPVIADAMKAGTFNFFRLNWILEEEKFLKMKPNIGVQLQFIRDYMARYKCQLKVFFIPSRSQVSDYYYQFEKQACLVNCPDFMSLKGPEYQIAQNTL
ncbi:MAG: SGNH/GDSL hydrolase family protein, partial [Bacteroidetes bacterium]|nr:SGNH/GDSL hydrolase family protein [Bacteroidota bacterium]